MTFALLAILDRIIGLYEQPATTTRFNAYLKMLEGESKGDLELPISGFNPMAKGHVLETLMELKKLDIERFVGDTLLTLNREIKQDHDHRIIKTAFNLSDDLKGGWTNRYTSDYQSKFKLNPLLKRDFCVPVFWASEKIDKRLIELRTRAACYRTLYLLNNKTPKTLAEHVAQEVFVCRHTETEYAPTEELENALQLFEKHKEKEEFTQIFAFFYGNHAALSLGNQPVGITEPFGGFRFIKTLSL